MKILTVCQAGNNRSVALASILKEEMGQRDVLNYGTMRVSPETEEMLCNWADLIMVTTKETDVPEKFRDKRAFLDVGPDRWGYTHHPEIQTLLREHLKNFNLS